MQEWARELGFSQIGVAGVDLSAAEAGLVQWLAQGFHGEMHYMASHGTRRARPAELVPGTVSVITARMDYLPRGKPMDGWQAMELSRLARPGEAIVSVYARGRDYHKVLRARLQKLSDRIAEAVGPFGHRVFTDSAPVLEAELAARSGQGWRGKHTLVLNREAGSMFFLGEIYVDMHLPESAPVTAHCGSCSACIAICPTQAIVAPHRIDARLPALGYTVSGWARTPREVPGITVFSGEEQYDAFLAQTDVLVCLLPLTEQTRGILGHRTFDALPRGAALIHCGRGEHLVEGELLAALESGQLRGAVVDVFEQEPLPPDHPLWSAPGVVVTPHMATMATYDVVVRQVVRNIAQLRAGAALFNQVDTARGY